MAKRQGHPGPPGSPAESAGQGQEQDLLRRAQGGDRRALRELLTVHMDPLYSRVILPRAGDAALAEDILRATMVTAMEKLPGYRWRGRSIYFWLRRIAVNKVLDHHRAQQRSRRMVQALGAEPEPAVLPGREPGAEEALIAEEERRLNLRRLERGLDALNPRYRRAVQLRLLEELPRQECARRLEVSVATFDVVLFRALKSLRTKMGEGS